MIAIEADVSDPGDVRRFFDTVEETWGRLDVLFTHAGINGVCAPIEQLDVDEWRPTIDVNLSGAFYTVKYAVPLLRRQGDSIIIMSSISGTTKFSDRGSSAYSASKAGQVAFMKLMALELAPDGIRVNAVCPGSISTLSRRTWKCETQRQPRTWPTTPEGTYP